MSVLVPAHVSTKHQPAHTRFSAIPHSKCHHALMMRPRDAPGRLPHSAVEDRPPRTAHQHDRSVSSSVYLCVPVHSGLHTPEPQLRLGTRILPNNGAINVMFFLKLLTKNVKFSSSECTLLAASIQMSSKRIPAPKLPLGPANHPPTQHTQDN